MEGSLQDEHYFHQGLMKIRIDRKRLLRQISAKFEHELRACLVRIEITLMSFFNLLKSQWGGFLSDHTPRKIVSVRLVNISGCRPGVLFRYGTYQDSQSPQFLNSLFILVGSALYIFPFPN